MQTAKQSELGIASFIFALIPIMLIIFFWILIGIESLPNTGGCKGCGNDSGWSSFMYSFISIFVTFFMGFIGFLFGLTSLFQEKVKNTYGKIGLVICGIYLLILSLSLTNVL